ncbi:hypothetical protein E3U43_013068 [Larimichthys crocea]|uniref:Uncharacterized protein n=1 Tax=Larimichthys crocea TaxID=215358 RepID=A0ACD3R8R2_LARCR|nr:hypothetical protein E3U43_013068 [Larimichthys crocea]
MSTFSGPGIPLKAFQTRKVTALWKWRYSLPIHSTRACCQARRVKMMSRRKPQTSLPHPGTLNLSGYALLDAARWDAASSPSIGAGNICGLPSVPCWSTMSAHTCGRKCLKYHPGLRSRHVTPPTVGSPVWTGARPSKSTGSVSNESTSLGQLETKSSHSTKPPSSPVGRPGKVRLTETEIMQDTSAAQKAAKLSQSAEDKSSKYIRDSPPPREEPATCALLTRTNKWYLVTWKEAMSSSPPLLPQQSEAPRDSAEGGGL